MSDIKLPWHNGSLRFNISVHGIRGGEPLVEYLRADELAPPSSHPERMEWVRKSYERFFEKVLENDSIAAASSHDLAYD